MCNTFHVSQKRKQIHKFSVSGTTLEVWVQSQTTLYVKIVSNKYFHQRLKYITVLLGFHDREDEACLKCV